MPDTNTPARVGFDLHITLVMVLSGLRAIVDQYGVHHIGVQEQGGCAYIDKETDGRLVPSCIVGVFFHNLGILRVLTSTTDCARKVEGACNLWNKGPLDFNLREELAQTWGITFEDEAFSVLMDAQQEQDGHSPWGAAVEWAAKKNLAERGIDTRDSVSLLLGLITA